MRRATLFALARECGRYISIHALHEESDDLTADDQGGYDQFQSTLSMRRATEVFGHGHEQLHISIHALHEESDRAVR